MAHTMQDNPDPPDQTNPRRRQRRKDDRPTEIIAAAMELWGERGFADTPLAMVAARAGIAKGTIYLYFPSKEALFAAAVQDRLAAMLDQAQAMTASPDLPAPDMLRIFLTNVYKQLHHGGVAILLRVMLSEGHRFPDLVQSYETQAISRGMATIRAILAQGAARGEFHPRAADLDPRMVMAPAMMTAIWGGVFKTNQPNADTALGQHIDLVLNGILP